MKERPAAQTPLDTDPQVAPALQTRALHQSSATSATLQLALLLSDGRMRYASQIDPHRLPPPSALVPSRPEVELAAQSACESN